MPYSIYHSILFTLLHSLWQLGLVYLLYKVFIFPAILPHPAQRKNILFFLSGFQLILSAFTFFNLNSNTLILSHNYFSGLVPDLEVSDVLYKNLFYIYCSLIAVRTLYISWHYRQQKKLILHSLIPVSVEIMKTVKRLSDNLYLSKKINCWCHAHITTPVVYGFLKPVIIFPLAALNTLSIQETETLLLHELAHIKYNDHLLNLLLIIQETILFFNPFMWLIAKDIRHEREKACDLLVINNGFEKSLYASALYKVAVPFQSLQMSLGATGKKKRLLQRIQFFTQANREQINNKGFPHYISSILCLVLVCFCSVLFIKNLNIKNSKGLLKSSSILVPSAKNAFVKSEVTRVINSNILIDGVNPADPKILTKTNNKTKEIKPTLEGINPLIKTNSELILPVYNVSYKEDANKNTRIIYLEEENSNGKKTVTMITVEREGEKLNVTPILKMERILVTKDSTKSITSSDTGEVFIYH